MKMRKMISAALALLLAVATAGVALAETYEGNPTTPCLSCHETLTPGIVKQWEESKHSLVNVKCYVCHHAREDDPSGYDHNGYRITAVPASRYCESCHPKEVSENARSKHASAAFPGPHMGGGRVNSAGRPGSCTSCHPNHSFSVAEARKPETCRQCHLGPDHPQDDIYEESKHGNLYAASGEGGKRDLPADQRGPGDIGAPTCAACHMGGFGGAVESSHDVGRRLKKLGESR